jgi:uncharacterized membrane protein YbhN (UPF0104 family)
MPGESAHPRAAAPRRSPRWPLWSALLVVSVAVAFLAVPALAGTPARLIKGCARWITIAGALELLSAVGFVVFFKLVFAGAVSWRRSAPAALRALGATTIVPGGGLIGPSMGAWSTSAERPSLSQLSRATITFVVLTNAPSAIVLAGLGTMLWLGLASGPAQTLLTILPALIAVGLLGTAWRAGRGPSGQRFLPSQRRWPGAVTRPVGALRDGLTDARALVIAADWKLGGALAYYAFDNAVLWASFHAYGRVPPLGVVVMGYLVGSLAGALPLPAGLGALDGGLIGALVLYGARPAPAAAAVLLYRGISLSVPTVLGAVGCACGPANRKVHLRVRRAGLGTHRVQAELAPAHTD